MSCEFHRFLSLSRTESRWTRRRRQASRSTRDHRRGQWSACSWVTAQPLASGRSNRSPAPSRMQISCESAISASCRPKLARYFLHQRSPSQAFQVTDPSIVYFTVNALCWKLNKVSEVCVAAVCREAYAESISVTVYGMISLSSGLNTSSMTPGVTTLRCIQNRPFPLTWRHYNRTTVLICER